MLRVACALVAAAAAGCAMPTKIRITTPENALVYQPAGPWKGEIDTPGIDPQDVTIVTEDNVELHGWYCPVERPRAVVLFAHGNAGAVPGRWPRLRWMNEQLGVSVLAFDYRGYGRSRGRPSEPGLLRDARAARKRLAELAGVPPEEVVLYGRSLGGGVLTQLAAEDGARALVLESTFTSLPDVANHKLPRVSPGWLMRNRYESIKHLPEYSGPLLVSHGAKDELAPIAMGRELYEAAAGPKHFYEAPMAGHNWLPTPEYTAVFSAFLAELRSAHSRASAADADRLRGPKDGAIIDQSESSSADKTLIATPLDRIPNNADAALATGGTLGDPDRRGGGDGDGRDACLAE